MMNMIAIQQQQHQNPILSVYNSNDKNKSDSTSHEVTMSVGYLKDVRDNDNARSRGHSSTAKESRDTYLTLKQ